MTTIPKTQNEALLAGAVRFNNGRPCARGHHADRYARNGSCVTCERINANASERRRKRSSQRKVKFRAEHPMLAQQARGHD